MIDICLLNKKPTKGVRGSKHNCVKVRKRGVIYLYPSIVFEYQGKKMKLTADLILDKSKNRSLSEITTLDLNNCHITELGQEISKCSQLSKLILSHNYLHSQESHLQELQSIKATLKWLNLSHNELDDITSILSLDHLTGI